MASTKTIINSLLLPVNQFFLLPQSLIFFVTSRCNASCDFCLYYDQLNNTNKNHVELSVDEVEKIAINYGKLHYLGLSGGEPFIRKDLIQLCQSFVDYSSVKVIDIPSNFYYGERMIEFVNQFCSANPFVTLDLQFSLDDLGEEHDKSRKVKGLFKKAIENYCKLYELKRQFANLQLKVNIVYLPENKGRILHIISEVDRLIKFDRLQVTYPHILLDKRPISDLMLLEDLSTYLKIAREADYIGNKDNSFDLYSIGLKSVKALYRKMLKNALLGDIPTGKYCEAGKNVVVINEIGDVYPCEMLWDESIGNLRDFNYSIKDVLKTNEYQDFRKMHLGAKGECNCTWSCAMNTQVSVNFKHFPSLAVNALKIISETK